MVSSLARTCRHHGLTILTLYVLYHLSFIIITEQQIGVAVRLSGRSLLTILTLSRSAPTSYFIRTLLSIIIIIIITYIGSELSYSRSLSHIIIILCNFPYSLISM